MTIQCGSSDMMRAVDGKLHSHLEWPKIKHSYHQLVIRFLIIATCMCNLAWEMTSYCLQSHNWHGNFACE